MVKIDVIHDAGQIKVITGSVAVMQGDPIVWCFHSDHPRVGGVRLEFPNGAPFLKPNSPPHTFTRKLENGTGLIHGWAPIYFSAEAAESKGGEPEAKVRKDKYTITFFDTEGKKLDELDPDIRTNGP